RPKAVRAACSLETHEDQQDEAAEGNESEQHKPSRLVLIVESADVNSQIGNESSDTIGADAKPHYQCARIFVSGQDKPQPGNADGKDDQKAEKGKHPVFLAAGSAGKFRVSFERKKHPLHSARESNTSD